MSALSDRLTTTGRTRAPERPARRQRRGFAPRPAVAAPLPAGATISITSRRPTLDEMLVGVWEGLRAAHAADCPVCGGTLLSRRGAGPAAGATAACEDCGSELS